MFASVWFWRVTQGTCNVREKCWTKKELFAGISHVLVISKFEDACAL